MAFSKVTLNGTTLMDVTQDTVSENTLSLGETATQANGVQTTGTLRTPDTQWSAEEIITDTYRTNASVSGVTYTWNANKTVLSVSSGGSPSSAVGWDQLFSSSSSFPTGMEAGGTYYAKFSSTGSNVYFYVYVYVGGSTSILVDRKQSDQQFTIPSNATGVIIRIWVNKSITVDEDVTFSILKLGISEKHWDIYDLVTDALRVNASVSGVTYTWNSDKTVLTVSSGGSPSSAVGWDQLFGSNSSFPPGMEAGGTYNAMFSSTGSNVYYYVYVYVGGSSSILVDRQQINQQFTIPSNATGIIIRIWVNSNVTVDEDVKFSILDLEWVPVD